MSAINEISFTLGKRKLHQPKIILSGPSGAGKTLSALILAAGYLDAPLTPDQTTTGKWSDIGIADTENGRSTLYIDQAFDYKDFQGNIRTVEIGSFHHFDFKPPYDWKRWVALINKAAETCKFLILDSLSAEWSGQGGILDFVGSLGGRFDHWKTGSAAHIAVLEAILRSPIPIIALLRSEQKHEIVSVPDGKGGEKKQVNKLGLKPQQREDVEYNFDVHLCIDHTTHMAAVATGKDCTGLFTSRTPDAITPDTGRMLASWAKGGSADPVGSRSWVAKRCAMLLACDSEAELLKLWEETRMLAGGFLTQEFHAKLKAAGTAAKDRLTKGQFKA